MKPSADHPWHKHDSRLRGRYRLAWRVSFCGEGQPFSIKVWAWDAEDAAEEARMKIPDAELISVVPIRE